MVLITTPFTFEKVFVGRCFCPFEIASLMPREINVSPVHGQLLDSSNQLMWEGNKNECLESYFALSCLIPNHTRLRLLYFARFIP